SGEAMTHILTQDKNRPASVEEQIVLLYALKSPAFAGLDARGWKQVKVGIFPFLLDTRSALIRDIAAELRLTPRTKDSIEETLARPDSKGPALSLSVVLEQFFRLIPPQQCRHPFLERPAPPLGIVIITSDEGFLGGLNSAVIQRALAAREGQSAELMVLGGRGKNYFTDHRQPFTQFPGIGEHIVSQRVEA